MLNSGVSHTTHTHTFVTDSLRTNKAKICYEIRFLKISITASLRSRGKLWEGKLFIKIAAHQMGFLPLQTTPWGVLLEYFTEMVMCNACYM